MQEMDLRIARAVFELEIYAQGLIKSGGNGP